MAGWPAISLLHSESWGRPDFSILENLRLQNCVYSADCRWKFDDSCVAISNRPRTANTMKSWQMFLVGVVALTLLYFLPHYEQTIPGIAAVAIVIAVIVGFLVHPKREVFIVRTNHWNHTPDEASLEHNCLLIKVELARLWLLFIPTFLAVTFLVVAATRGSTWNFPLIDRFWNLRGYMVISIRVLVVVVWWTVSTWVSERWALRGADSACSAE